MFVEEDKVENLCDVFEKIDINASLVNTIDAEPHMVTFVSSKKLY